MLEKEGPSGGELNMYRRVLLRGCSIFSTGKLDYRVKYDSLTAGKLAGNAGMLLDMNIEYHTLTR